MDYRFLNPKILYLQAHTALENNWQAVKLLHINVIVLGEPMHHVV